MDPSSSGQCNQENDASKYNEDDSLDPRIQVTFNFGLYVYMYVFTSNRMPFTILVGTRETQFVYRQYQQTRNRVRREYKLLF